MFVDVSLYSVPEKKKLKENKNKRREKEKKNKMRKKNSRPSFELGSPDSKSTAQPIELFRQMTLVYACVCIISEPFTARQGDGFRNLLFTVNTRLRDRNLTILRQFEVTKMANNAVGSD